MSTYPNTPPVALARPALDNVKYYVITATVTGWYSDCTGGHNTSWQGGDDGEHFNTYAIACSQYESYFMHDAPPVESVTLFKVINDDWETCKQIKHWSI